MACLCLSNPLPQGSFDGNLPAASALKLQLMTSATVGFSRHAFGQAKSKSWLSAMDTCVNIDLTLKHSKESISEWGAPCPWKVKGMGASFLISLYVFSQLLQAWNLGLFKSTFLQNISAASWPRMWSMFLPSIECTHSCGRRTGKECIFKSGCPLSSLVFTVVLTRKGSGLARFLKKTTLQISLRILL